MKKYKDKQSTPQVWQACQHVHPTNDQGMTTPQMQFEHKNIIRLHTRQLFLSCNEVVNLFLKQVAIFTTFSFRLGTQHQSNYTDKGMQFREGVIRLDQIHTVQ